MRHWHHTLRRWRVKLAHLVLLPEMSEEDGAAIRQQVEDDGRLTRGFALMCGLAAGIAMLGLLQSSTAVVIGAMLVSPLMGPIAALGFGFAALDGHRIRDAAKVVMVGAAIGITTGILITWASPIRNATPEIIARTQPTLLDLVVALLSGLAGGYATVMKKGGTAIGVSIATALMPPLATAGYGLAVWQPAFALGALLLFLTNLSAIAFAFALVARLSGAALPEKQVDWSPRYVLAGLAAFGVLAVPLGLTLSQVSREASLRKTARAAIAQATGGANSRIAQLDVSWPLLGDPDVSALVVTPHYATDAEQVLRKALATAGAAKVTVKLQQVLAADLPAQTQAMVDAAMERTAAGIAADVPPFARIRAAIDLPTSALWVNRSERMVFAAPVAMPGWTLADYRRIEQTATQAAEGWRVAIIPPTSAGLTVALDGAKEDPSAIPPDLAIWAVQRWGLNRVILVGRDNEIASLLQQLRQAGIAASVTPPEPQDKPQEATLRWPAPPSPAVPPEEAAGPSATGGA